MYTRLNQQTKETKTYFCQLRTKLNKPQTEKQSQSTVQIGEESNENKTNKYVPRKGKKEKKDQKCKVNRDKEALYTLKIKCQGERRVGKANKGINVEKIITGLKN